MAKRGKLARKTEPRNAARQLAEARAQQAATAEILRVISRSPADIQPVCDAIAERAMKLCGAMFGVVAKFDGEKVHLVSIHGVSRKAISAIRAIYPLAPSGKTVTARSIRDRAPAQIPDVLADREYAQKKVARAVGYRGIISVPLLRGKRVVGAIAVARAQAGAYSRREIALLKTFADQAVIAIENARLFNETKEALERQTATAEILKVISSSPTDTQPVFDAIARSAYRLIGGFSTAVARVFDDVLHLVAFSSTGEAGNEALKNAFPMPVSHSKAARTAAPVCISDTEALPESASALRQLARVRGFRSIVIVPMLRGGVATGTISVTRREPGEFTDHQVELLKTFADQAVIAIENVRLFNETKEALERQTATADILAVISESPTDVQPVFQAIAERARALCKADVGMTTRLEGTLVHLEGANGLSAEAEEAARHAFPMTLELAAPNIRRALGEQVPIQIPDIRLEPGYPNPEVAERMGFRSIMSVPLLHEGRSIGTIGVARREPGLFPDAAVALLQTFARQAVIAIENVRLFNETKEALERQTATGEILSSISGSITATQPVFDAIVRNLIRLFGTRFAAVFLLRDGKFELAGIKGERGYERLAERFPMPADERTIIGRAILSGEVMQFAPMVGNSAAPPASEQIAREFGFNSQIAAPMVREGKVIGAIVTAHRDAVPFNDKQVALIKSFADQAVIAIENVRLFNETKEALERQTATAEILKVISESPTDVTPVFDAIAERARILCGARLGFTTRFDGELLHLIGYHGSSPEAEAAMRAAFPVKPGPGTLNGRCFLAGAPVQIADVQVDPAYKLSKVAQAAGWRSGLAVPILQGSKAIGVVGVGRQETGEFPQKMVALLQTFADQAVIAIQNARLFNETQEALQRQTATSEILSVISSTPSDTQPVFEAIVNSTQRLIGGKSTVLLLRRDPHFVVAAYAGPAVADLPEEVRVAPLDPEKNFPSRAILGGEIVHIPDWEGDDIPAHERTVGKSFGIKSGLMVPLLREGKGIGAIAVTRGTAGPYQEKEIALLRSFADQAVIAIENARLFNETKEALDRQTAISEILRVISSSPSDVKPVLDAVAERAARICDAQVVDIILAEGGTMRVGATVGDLGRPTGEAVALDRSTVMGRSIVDKVPVHVADLQNAGEEFPRGRELALKYGHRTILGVPLLREGRALGAILVRRAEVRPFDDKHVALLRTFADQAAIAIENVRLFNETKEALERQTATAEILKVISSSPTDTQPVFDAIARSSNQLLGGYSTVVARIVDDALHLVGFTTTDAQGDAALKRSFPIALADFPVGDAVRRGETVHILDTEQVDDSLALLRDLARTRGFRSLLFCPLVRDRVAIGVISVTRRAPGRFAPHQVELLQTFADQAVIAIENVRLFNETKEALEQQTATAEILKVIASSPSDVQPVFNAIVQSAMRLAEPWNAAISMREGDQIYLRAAASPRKLVLDDVWKIFPIPFDPAISEVARAIAEHCVVEIADAQGSVVGDIERGIARAGRYQSAVYVPLVREGEGIGSIVLTHPEQSARLTEKQLALAKTFADQAVIAIQNARLFNETREALERQTATAEILKVISSSPTDVKPVFDAIVQSAGRLFAPCDATITMLENGFLQWHATAAAGTSRIQVERLKEVYPLPFDPDRSPSVRAILERRIIEIADAAAPDAPEFTKKAAQAGGFRSAAFVPLVREGEGIGTIILTRPDSGLKLSEKQISLLQTFADQAVIAIENVRLFNETKEALERQTATAEILKVIGSSPTDTQPVFEAIVNSGVRLFPGAMITVARPEGGTVRAAAIAHEDSKMVAGWRERFTTPLSRDRLHGAAILDARLIDIPDAEAEKDGPFGPGVRNFLLSGNRAVTIMPMLHGEGAIGAISVTRATPGPLSDKQIAMLRTFADQAVIAIENVRLFKELQARTEALTRSVGQLTALGEVGRAISSTLDLQTVLKTIVTHAMRLTGLDAGVIYEYDEASGRFELRASENFDDESVAGLRGAGLRKGEGAVGTCVATREPVQVHDIHAPDYPARLRGLLDRSGFRAILAVPLLREDQTIGALMMLRKAPGEFASDVVDMLKTFASQSALAIQNARLFREIAEKGRQLEEASKHKSQFLASMSHELRTPLNAILGFNEMILAQVYGEVPEAMKEPLTDVQTSGKHLLRLINNVLDLAKIEAGRMELAPADYSVQDTVESVRSTLRPLAAEKGLEFIATVPADIPLAYGDQGRITQCLMNIAGNSLKFTKAGKVEIAVAQHDGTLQFRVADTGMGIAPEKIGSLFQEFKQTDATIASEFGGSGLGLSITKKFIEMHGGRIWVESELGKGSTFLFEIPLRVAQ